MTVKKEVSEKEVYDVFEFAKNAYNKYGNGVFTPDLVNSRMKDINMNPLLANDKGVTDALANPKSNEDKLIGFSEYFELTNMVYKRMLGYMSQMLAFDYTYTCTNATGTDYSSKAYKKDLDIVNSFLDKFDVKREFKKATSQMFRNETFYSVLRTEGEKFVFQELPQKHCKITQRTDYGLAFDFNMMWFVGQVGVDIDSYPKVFKKFYNKMFDSKTGEYKPSSLNRNGEWAYWTQTSQDDGFWAFKTNPESITQVPYLSPLFSDIVLAPYVRQLQTNKYVLEATNMLIGLVPMLENNKTGNVKDMMAIEPATLGKFLGLLRSAITDVVGVGAVPFKDIKSVSFAGGKTDLQKQYNENLSASSGINSRLIYSTDKPNAIETQASIRVDSYIAEYLYHQFNQFMDFNINKLTKKFKFKFIFEGTEFDGDREVRFSQSIKLAEMGIVLPQKISASIGMQPHDFMRQLEEARMLGFVDNLTPIMMAHQLSGKDGGDGGRPQKSTSQLTESGSATRDAGSNLEKGGSV